MLQITSNADTTQKVSLRLKRVRIVLCGSSTVETETLASKETCMFNGGGFYMGGMHGLWWIFWVLLVGVLLFFGIPLVLKISWKRRLARRR